MTPALPAVFLDRDGTLTVEKEYWYKPQDLEFIPGAVAAVRALNRAGFLVIVVTNQSGVARGFFSEADVQTLHKYMQEQLNLQAARCDRIYYCPHHPDGQGEYKKSCEFRKPNILMFAKACQEFQIDKQRCWMIGDKPTDLDFAANCGIRGVLVRTGYGGKNESGLGAGLVTVVDDLQAAVKHVLSHTTKG